MVLHSSVIVVSVFFVS